MQQNAKEEMYLQCIEVEALDMLILHALPLKSK